MGKNTSKCTPPVDTISNQLSSKGVAVEIRTTHWENKDAWHQEAGHTFMQGWTSQFSMITQMPLSAVLICSKLLNLNPSTRTPSPPFPSLCRFLLPRPHAPSMMCTKQDPCLNCVFQSFPEGFCLWLCGGEHEGGSLFVAGDVMQNVLLCQPSGLKSKVCPSHWWPSVPLISFTVRTHLQLKCQGLWLFHQV